MMLEVLSRSVFMKSPLGTVWAEWLLRGTTPCFPHTEYRRWGLLVEDGELLIYLGRLHVILTAPKRTLIQVQ